MSEVKALFERWIDKTETILKYELNKRGIGVNDELMGSLRHEVTTLADGYIRGEFSFLTRGRFVDMGAGRGYTAGGKRKGSDLSRGRRIRRPKVWYSRAMYGRLNDLHGAVGYELMEEAIQSVAKPLKGLR